MSKLPAVARGDQPQHQSKLIVRGVPPGPATEMALNLLRAPLKRFHLAQQSRVRDSIDGIAIHKAHTLLPGGAKAVYTNMYGQERLELHVSSATARQIEERLADNFWDWALVELVIDDAPASDSYFSAFISPEIYAAEWGTHSEDGILRYPPWDGTLNPVAEASTQRVASLRIDLRPYRGGTVQVDLRGWIEGHEQEGLPGEGEGDFDFVSSRNLGRLTRIDRVSGGYEIVATANDYAIAIAHFPELAGTPRRDPSVGGSSGVFTRDPIWNYNFPPDVFPNAWTYLSGTGPVADADPNTYMSTFAAARATITTYWDDGHVAVKSTAQGGCVWTPPDSSSPNFTNVIPSPYSDGQYFITLYDYKLLYVPIVRLSPRKSARLKVIFFKGNPLDAASEHDTGPDQYLLWESRDRYPERWELHELDVEVTVGSQPDPSDWSAENHFGMPMLGTLTINPDQVRGGFKFEPA